MIFEWREEYEKQSIEIEKLKTDLALAVATLETYANPGVSLANQDYRNIGPRLAEQTLKLIKQPRVPLDQQSQAPSQK